MNRAAASNPLIRKSQPAEWKVLDEAQGLVEAYVNTLGVVDHDGEVLAPGAFTESIDRRLPPVAWFHDQTVIVGGVIAAAETADGRLLATMQFDLDTEPGAYAFKMVSRGRVREWSVGFYCLAERTDMHAGKAVRVIERVDWVEVSPVLRGASPGTATVSAKQAPSADAGSGGTAPLPDTDTDTDTDRQPAVAPALTTPNTAQAAVSSAVSTEETRVLLMLRRAQLEALGVRIPPALLPGPPGHKEGRRNSTADAQRIQDAHDLLVALGAMCAEPDHDGA